MSQPLGRATRKGVTLSFGSMIALPVTLYTAVGEDKTAKLHNACNNNHPATRVQQKYVCPLCEGESGFVKVRPEGSTLVVVTPEVLEAANAADLQYKDVIDITVHSSEEVSQAMQPSGSSYYLDIETPALARLYGIIATMVTERPELAFMAKFTLKTAVSVFRLTVAGDGILVLQQQANPELVRELPSVVAAPALAAEIAMASQLADALLAPFTTEGLGRDKGKVLAEYTLGQIATMPAGAVAASSAGVGDLTAAFEAALLAAGGAPKAVPTRKAAPRKSAAAKTAAAKTTTRKAS